jgi:hypothetical protein
MIKPIPQISQLNSAFIIQRQNDAASKGRDACIKSIEQASAKFFDFHSKLSGGETFYSNLLVCLLIAIPFQLILRIESTFEMPKIL